MALHAGREVVSAIYSAKTSLSGSSQPNCPAHLWTNKMKTRSVQF